MKRAYAAYIKLQTDLLSVRFYCFVIASTSLPFDIDRRALFFCLSGQTSPRYAITTSTSALVGTLGKYNYYNNTI